MSIVGRIAPVNWHPDEPPPGGTPPATPPAETPPAPPPAVTREEFSQVTETLRGVSETLARLNQVLAAPPQREEAVAVGTEITAEQYEEAIRVGDGKVARLYVDQERAKDRKAMETRVGQVEAVGTESLSGVVELTAISALPYYKKYEKEIKDIIKTMPPAGRINPQAHKRAYDMIIGGHIDEINAEEREKAARAASDPAQAGRPGASGPVRKPAGGTEPPETPEPRDLGGEEAESALALVGRDKEQQARGMGYKSWADYMEKTKDYR